MTTRRGLFGWIAALPLVPHVAAAAPVEVVTRYTHVSYDMGYVLTHEALRAHTNALGKAFRETYENDAVRRLMDTL